MDTFLKTCYLEKVLYYQILDAIVDKENEPLSIGKPILLDDEKDEDGKTVVVAKACGFTVGILSDEDAKDIKPYVTSKWTKGGLYECKVHKFDAKEEENKMLSIAIYIKQYNEKKSENNQAEGVAGTPAAVPAPIPQE